LTARRDLCILPKDFIRLAVIMVVTLMRVREKERIFLL